MQPFLFLSVYLAIYQKVFERVKGLTRACLTLFCNTIDRQPSCDLFRGELGISRVFVYRYDKMFFLVRIVKMCFMLLSRAFAYETRFNMMIIEVC